MTRRVPLGTTGFDVHPLNLGGNVWGWTADRDTSFAVLDAYVAGGGNFLDTADGYSRWVDGHRGGESETVIGEWLSRRGRRDDLIITTKVFGHPDNPGLGGTSIKRACEASLRRLQTDHIDVYLAHHDDPEVPMEESLAAFDELITEGKVRAIGASNFSPDRLAQALETSAREGLAPYRLSQDHYNLMQRGYEATLRPVMEDHGLVETPYYALASGFLTGKYRPGVEADSARGGAAGRWLRGHASDYLDERGIRILAHLDEAASAHGCAVATVALAWLLAQPTVASVVASARALHQLPDLMAVADVTLTAEEIADLDAASAGLHATPGELPQDD